MSQRVEYAPLQVRLSLPQSIRELSQRIILHLQPSIVDVWVLLVAFAQDARGPPTGVSHPFAG
ncbi:hypothetical protein HHU13_14325 [Nocardia globerula]|nr:hypothetical protein [Nocardia globerula]